MTVFTFEQVHIINKFAVTRLHFQLIILLADDCNYNN